MDIVFVPMYLHIDPHVFAAYPEAYKAKTRSLLLKAMSAGFAGNPRMVKADG